MALYYCFIGDLFADRDDFRAFWVGRGYGLNDTADIWFDRCEIIEDGRIDRALEWSNVFANLDTSIYTF